MKILNLQLVYSSLFEIIVDFTRDYDVIKQALTKIDHYDKTCIANMLTAVNNILLSNWGSQNFCQVSFSNNNYSHCYYVIKII